MKDSTIHCPIIENHSSIGSSSSSVGSSSNLKNIMLETAALSSASVSLLRSSTSTSLPVPVPAPTRNATWSTNTSVEALKSMHRLFSILLSAPKILDIFSCTYGGGDTTSYDHQKGNTDFTKKMNTCTTSKHITKKNHCHGQDENVHLGKGLNEVKED